MPTLRKLKTIRSHSGHARFLAECSEDVAGTVASSEVPRDAYHFSPDRSVYVWNGRTVVILEARHRCFEVWEVPASMVVASFRAPLGAVVGRLLQELESAPISDAYGVNPPPADAEAIARSFGWTRETIEEALVARGVSDRWVYQSGLGLVLDGEGR